MVSSCATIFTGTKEKIEISTLPADAEIYYKGTEVANPYSEKIKKTDTRIYTIKKDGYLDNDVCIFTNDLKNSIFLNVFLYNIFVSTDVNLGGPTKLEDNHKTVELYKLPEPIESSEMVYFNDFEWLINDEDTVVYILMDNCVGNAYTYADIIESEDEESEEDEEEEEYDGPFKSRNSKSELVKDMNDILENQGFNCAFNKDQSMFALSNAAYSISATIDTIIGRYHYLFAYSNPSPRQITTDLVITYTIKDINEDVVLTKTINTNYSYFVKEDDNNDLVFDKAFYLFLSDEEVIETLQTPVDAKEFESEDELLVLKNDNPLPHSVENAAKATVTIKGEKGYGSGCLISSDGYLVTNYHVINNEDSPVVILGDNTELDAEIIRTSKAYDLALLKLDAEGFTYFKVDTLSVANIGEDVFSIGTGGDISLGQSLSKGIVSGKRMIGSKEFIQTDVSVNPGSSGGALVSSEGELIGIVNAKLVATSVEGIGFAIPVPMMIKYLKIAY
jgi:S1-C subfamily serine protease